VRRWSRGDFAVSQIDVGAELGLGRIGGTALWLAFARTGGHEIVAQFSDANDLAAIYEGAALGVDGARSRRR
jgi:hypothetical protein